MLDNNYHLLFTLPSGHMGKLHNKTSGLHIASTMFPASAKLFKLLNFKFTAKLQRFQWD